MSLRPQWRLWSDAALRVVFDEERDLQLKVGPRKITLVVCSKLLARASPVFKKMLFGGFAESKLAGDVEWVVELPEDDINGMHLLMHIVHGNREKVPKKMSDSLRFCKAPGDLSAVLRSITCTADKFDMSQPSFRNTKLPVWGKKVLLPGFVAQQFLDAGIEIKALAEPSLYKRSVYDLYAELKHLKESWQTEYFPYNCTESYGVFQAAKTLVERPPLFSLPGSQIKHLWAQMRKSGIREDWLLALKAKGEAMLAARYAAAGDRLRH
ncbi:hypothetical protein GE09DRAFT_1274826 [Coniochaeta sp. 2T2.1]|nr:hypothetical protein GE09DRAFT_1274826 [Coniochaeta sp. 2T2.1]